MVPFFKPLLLLLSCLVAFCFTSFSQKKIHFLRISSAINIPVNDAFVQTVDGTFSALSDENGIAAVKKLPSGLNQLIISRIGFETKTIDVETLGVYEGIATVILEPKISTLAEVTIRAATQKGIFKTISDFDIHLRPINNSQEVLRIVPGLFIGQHAGGGKAEQIFLRGFDIDHGTDINITVDGMPVNMVSHAHGQGYADLHFVIPELIDKVSFDKGPYFADKGNFSTAGSVDFKTKNYLENNFIKVEAGQFNTFRGIAGINLLRQSNNKSNQSLYLAGETSYTDGYFESPQHFNRFNGLIKYHGSIGKQTTLTGLISGFTSKWNASGQIPERSVSDGSIGYFGAIDNTEGGNTSRYNASIDLVKNLSNGGILRNNAFYTRYSFELYSNFTFYKINPLNGDQIRQKESRNILGYQGSYQKDYRLGNIETQTTAGLQIRYDIIKNNELSRTKDRTTTTSPLQLGDINEANSAAYFSQKFLLSKKLDITTALRFDHFYNQYNDQLISEKLTSNASIISPKVNFNYRLNNKVQLYWYNGRGFHSNDTRVTVAQGGKTTLPPAWGTDIGGIFKIGKRLLLQSALWYLWLDQEFVYVGDEGVVEAGGKTRRFGADASIRYEVVKNLYADVDVNVSLPKALDVAKEESNIPLAPKFTSIGGLTYRKISGINGSLRYRWMGDRPANESNSAIAEGYFVVDAAVNYTQRKWEAGIAIQNVLNAKWKETQFETESRLQNEPLPVSEIHFTPGSPFFFRINFTFFL